MRIALHGACGDEISSFEHEATIVGKLKISSQAVPCGSQEGGGELGSASELALIARPKCHGRLGGAREAHSDTGFVFQRPTSTLRQRA